MPSSASIFFSINWERDLAPSPAVSNKKFRKRTATLQFSGPKLTLRPKRLPGKGVTFGGIEEGGVELLLPPQQIRARHGSIRRTRTIFLLAQSPWLELPLQRLRFKTVAVLTRSRLVCSRVVNLGLGNRVCDSFSVREDGIDREASLPPWSGIAY